MLGSHTNTQFNLKLIKRNKALYLLVLPAVVYLILFKYWPMYGVQIAFRNFKFADGITGSTWVGTKWFERFFNSPLFGSSLKNTLTISIYSLVAGFPLPIIFALMLNAIISTKFKRTVQTVTYMPHFISTVVIVSMLNMFLSPTNGIINTMIKGLGGSAIHFMGIPAWFPHIYVWSGIWQGFGWSSIIYFAALSSVSPELHEAAQLDGATRLQRIYHVDLPAIADTIVIMLIMSCGGILSVGYEKVYLMQNDLNMQASEVISTYVYKQGLINTKYSYSAAVGLFNGVVNFVMLSMVNFVTKRMSGVGLW